MEEWRKVLCRMVRETYLALDETQEEQLAREVEGLLENVAVLASLPVAAASARPPLEPDELRADELERSLAREQALANAPATHNAFVAVPKIMKSQKKGDGE